ncbi:hypothetical protein [Pantoea septica]|uniref:hypothetical protein n=1 Tax=Pantoea TaxID=53335 RepID=UPI0028A71D08|nr:hypothetical protein [Pantoea septica]
MYRLKARFGGLFLYPESPLVPTAHPVHANARLFSSNPSLPHQKGQSMHHMDSISHHMPYWWSACLAFFSTLTLYDCVICIGAAISAFFTIKTYYASRRERRQQLEEERKRTEVLRACLDSVIIKPESELTTAAKVIVKAVTKATEGERMDDMTYL